MFKYETHLHTSPVSKCARAGVRENLEFYKGLGYDGVFVTNHFIDGNIDLDRTLPYEDQIEFFFSDYESALEIGKELGIKVFLGAELAYKGTDFLVYGLDKAWFLSHPEIMSMKKSEELTFLAENGALIIQAHPFREAKYIDHVRLFPRHVHGIETVNANRTEFENKMAEIYAENYGLPVFAGSDNHKGASQTALAGIWTEAPIENELDFIQKYRSGEVKIFSENLSKE